VIWNQRREFLWCYCNINIYVVCMLVLIISSPYLLMFDDYCVHGTCEQMMLQVVLVRHRVGTGLDWDKEFSQSFNVFCFGIICKLLLDFDFCNRVIIMILKFII